MTQREQASAEARSRILAAAAEVIVRDGLAQVRMASIARAAGVSAGLLHYHFDTKELLFGEVLRYSHARSAELNQRALADAGDDPAVRLASFLDRCMPSDEQRALLIDLEACNSPRTCPHGRPTMIHLSVDMLERQFGRRGAR